jgi:hypothetical protein
VACPIEEIRVAAGSQNFAVQGNFLTTLDGTEIVRLFGFVQDVIVPTKVELLRQSCFRYNDDIRTIDFEVGSKLREIGRSAIAECDALTGIKIPASVTVIDEAAFSGCTVLEYCSFVESTSPLRIEKGAFTTCHLLKSFYVPARVESIGERCFRKCASLFFLEFGSGESFKKIVGELTLGDFLEHIGFNELSSLFKITIDEVGLELGFAGWVLANDGTAHLTLVQDIR